MSAVLSSQTIVKRAERVLFTQLDDELLAIDGEQGFLYSLNETGGLIWDAIAEPALVSDVCDRLVEGFEADEATCQRAVIALLEQLCDAGLAEVVSEPR